MNQSLIGDIANVESRNTIFDTIISQIHTRLELANCAIGVIFATEHKIYSLKVETIRGEHGPTVIAKSTGVHNEDFIHDNFNEECGGGVSQAFADQILNGIMASYRVREYSSETEGAFRIGRLIDGEEVLIGIAIRDFTHSRGENCNIADAMSRAIQEKFIPKQ